eukprot:TRINITY_DN2836_c0_g1_i1.p1 TRINITY_DN2836_c0_g1~~TRINITY_DN2836_c0_g1_i1.p1  ORF type:complete len:346 (+),score=54.42 TRINITY_DN2836_c0_g1_i1:22-1059(+)
MAARSIVRIGIIGTANIANKFVDATKGLSNCVVVAIGSRDLNKAQQFAQKWSIPKAYGSYQQVIEDPDVDLVYIPLPTSLHKEWTIKSALHLKHVICEKPLAPTYEDAQEMVRECIRNNVQFMDGTYWTHSTRTRKMQQHFPETGGITNVMSKFTWTVSPGNIRLSTSTEPLGALGDLGWYCIRGVLFGFNYEIPHSVFGLATYSTPEQPNMAFSGILTYNDGRQAHFSCSFLESTTQHLDLGGKLGNIYTDDFVIPWNSPSFDRGTGLETSYMFMNCRGIKTDYSVKSDLTQVQEMITDMVDIIREKKLNPFWWEVALKTHMLLILLLKSSVINTPITVSKSFL